MVAVPEVRARSMGCCTNSSLRLFRWVDSARDGQLENGNLQNVTLIVESSSGGDQQEVGTGTRIVTQLKAKSDEGAWSFQEVVRGLPQSSWSPS